jgi:acetyltransferase-like isoleucine patch superfamily enzyme
LIVHPGANVGRGSELSIVKGGTIEIGEQVMIGRASRLNCGENESLSIGKGTTFYANVYLSGNISIGQNCLFGANISILTGSHLARTRKPIREQDEDYLKLHGKPFSKPVTIGDDCWIGNNAIILPGVSLPDGCVVGAGSVVTKSFEPYSIVVGNPARFLKMRE